MKTVLWLGGWGSSWPQLHPWLSPLAPEAVWINIDPHQVSRNPEYLAATLQAADGPTMVLAWSLGALQLLHYLQAQGWPAKLPVVLLSPIARLSGSGAPWPTRVLDRMRNRLRKDPDTVLEEFCGLMVGDNHSEASDSFCRSWLESAKAQSLSDLDAGLEALQALRLGDGPYPFSTPNLFLIGDPQDPISPFDLEEWRRRLPRAIHRPAAVGHIPFLFDFQVVKWAMDQALSLCEEKV